MRHAADCVLGRDRGESEASFGEDAILAALCETEPFTFTSDTGGIRTAGDVSAYGGGGFICDLKGNLSKIEQTAARLRVCQRHVPLRGCS